MEKLKNVWSESNADGNSRMNFSFKNDFVGKTLQTQNSIYSKQKTNIATERIEIVVVLRGDIVKKGRKIMEKKITDNAIEGNLIKNVFFSKSLIDPL